MAGATLFAVLLGSGLEAAVAVFFGSSTPQTAELQRRALATFADLISGSLFHFQCLVMELRFNHSLLYTAVPCCHVALRCSLQQVN